MSEIDEDVDLSVAAVAELAVVQLRALLELVDSSGRRLQDNAALFAEHGGSLEDLRDVVKKTAELGEAMVTAVEQTRSLLDEEGVW